MDINGVLADTKKKFEEKISHLREEYGRLQAGRANASLVENIAVEVYGSMQPLKAIAGISIPEPRTIQIQPWDRGVLSAIEKAIVGTGLGLNPVNDGIVVRINIPPLTEERRKDLVKHLHKLAEGERIAVRTTRIDAKTTFEKMKLNNEITEDDLNFAEKKLQEEVDNANKKIEEIAAAKEKDIMTV